jgi:hypothetical protein
METALVGDLGGTGAAEFDGLDRSAGAAGSYHRLRQRQADRRWAVRYLRATEGGRLTAAIPVYEYRGKAWPSPHYDAATWPLPGGRRPELVPAACLLVGGCADARSSLHVRCRRGPGPLRRLVAELAAAAAARDRCLVFPYFDGRARAALAEATADRVAWVPLLREAQLREIADPGWERSLGAKPYATLRRDRELIAGAGLTGSVHRWAEVAEEAGELIAAHNNRKGEPDHPEFARLRYAEWDQCEGVELIVLRTAGAGLTGLLAALVWQDELQLVEMGLTGVDGPDRLAAYLDLVFHRPLALARERGLRTIRLGSAAEVPKRSRGAVFEELYGGVLDRDRTREVADGCR